MGLWVQSVQFLQKFFNITESIIFTEEQTPHKDLPAVIMIAMPGYKGPTLWHKEDGTPIVPIVPFTVRWQSKSGKQCLRTQFPVRVAYAVTIHKSQGMTVNKAVVELGDHDFTRGLTFVAISRVRAIGDIVCSSEIRLGRLEKLGGATNLLQEDVIRRGGLNFMDAEEAEELEFLMN